jgi:hypothetical protein
MKTYPFAGPFVQALINYLQKRPWDEANPFLMEISKIAAEVDQPQIQMPKVNGKEEQPEA